MTLTGTYLDAIVDDVRRRLPAEYLLGTTATGRRTRSLVESIARSRPRGELAVIGEVKRRSPSLGAIADVDPSTQAQAYADGGAAAISVLTERDHFDGRLEDMQQVSAAVDVPVLRKDFILETRQLEVAHALGADAVLLIAALHDDDALAALVAAAHAIGLEVLLEVHDRNELERAVASDADVLGINNRDLRTFEVDLAVSEQLAPLVQDGRPVVAESGVRTAQDAERMRAAGVDALLVGEALMRADRPAEHLRRLATAGTRAAGSA